MFLRPFTGVYVLLSVFSACSSWALSQCIECKDLIEGVRLNASGIRKYDVLVNVSTSLVGTKSQQDHSNNWVRIKCDTDKKVAVQIVRETGGTEFDLDDKATPTVVTVVSERSIIEIVPGQIDRKKQTQNFLEGMIDGNIYSLELVGIQYFPPVYWYSASGPPDVNGLWGVLQQRAFEKGKLLELADEISVKIPTTSSHNSNLETINAMYFDSVTRMPVSKSFWTRNITSDKSMGLQFERYQWFEHEGTYLPLEIHGETKRPPLPNESEHSTLDLRVNFYWLSINKSLDDAHFNAEYWREMRHIVDATSPKLVEIALNQENK